MLHGSSGKNGETFPNTIEEAARLGPYIDKSASKNVTALLGKTTYLNCRVKNINNKTVSVSSVFFLYKVPTSFTKMVFSHNSYFDSSFHTLRFLSQLTWKVLLTLSCISLFGYSICINFYKAPSVTTLLNFIYC